MEGALDVVASILTHGQATARTCPWAGLRYEWTAKLPHQLSDRGYSRATIQKQLAALRGVLREAWRLGLMDAETFQRATDIRPPKGQGLAPGAGRAITRVGSLRDLATVYARQGSPEKAVELLAVVLHHPARAQNSLSRQESLEAESALLLGEIA